MGRAGWGYVAWCLLFAGACSTPFEPGDTRFHCFSDEDCLVGYACQFYPGSTRSLCLASPRWEQRTDRTIIDHHLGLKWQDDLHELPEPCGTIEGVAWRVPTIDELRSLVDPRDCLNTALGGRCEVSESPIPCLADNLDCNPADACRTCPGAACYHDETIWGSDCPPRPLRSTSPVDGEDNVFWALNLKTGRVVVDRTMQSLAPPLTRCVTTL